MIRQKAAAFRQWQITVGLHQTLEKNWNAGKGPVLSRRDAVRLGARLVEPARDDRIDGRVQRLDAGDGGFADLGGGYLAASHEIGEAEGIVSAILLGLHQVSVATWVPSAVVVMEAGAGILRQRGQLGINAPAAAVAGSAAHTLQYNAGRSGAAS